MTEGSDVVTGTARITDGAEFRKVESLVKEKYGVWVTVVKLMNTVRSAMGKGGQSTSAVIISLD